MSHRVFLFKQKLCRTPRGNRSGLVEKRLFGILELTGFGIVIICRETNDGIGIGYSIAQNLLKASATVIGVSRTEQPMKELASSNPNFQ